MRAPCTAQVRVRSEASRSVPHGHEKTNFSLQEMSELCVATPLERATRYAPGYEHYPLHESIAKLSTYGRQGVSYNWHPSGLGQGKPVLICVNCGVLERLKKETYVSAANVAFPICLSKFWQQRMLKTNRWFSRPQLLNQTRWVFFAPCVLQS